MLGSPCPLYVPMIGIPQSTGDILLQSSRKVICSLPSTSYVLCLLLQWVEEFCDLSFVKSKKHISGNPHIACPSQVFVKGCSAKRSGFPLHFLLSILLACVCARCDFTVVGGSCFVFMLNAWLMHCRQVLEGSQGKHCETDLQLVTFQLVTFS